MQEESVERELRLADVMAKKVENMKVRTIARGKVMVTINRPIGRR